jgi:hypothetical protein
MHLLEQEPASKTTMAKPARKDPACPTEFRLNGNARQSTRLQAPADLQRPAGTPFTGVFQPRLMLGLLVRCYARQIYDSRQILEILVRETAGPGIDSSFVPTSADISLLRNSNRETIRSRLAEVLLMQAALKLASGFITQFNGEDVVAEASRRLIMASFIDHLQTDECGAHSCA